MTDISIRIHMFMSNLRSNLVSAMKREEGQDLIEYAMLGGLIAAALIAVAALGVMTGAVSSMANGVAGCIDFTSGGCDPF